MDFRAILTALAEAQVDFIVVGGVAAVLQGVPVHTLDLDIVHSRADENLDRLATVLTEFEACYREHLPTKRVEPRREDLGLPGHHLLETSAGFVDLLGAIVGGRGYDELVGDCITLKVAGRELKVLDLETLIQLKEEMGRDRDLAQLPTFRQTLAERDRRS